MVYNSYIHLLINGGSYNRVHAYYDTLIYPGYVNLVINIRGWVQEGYAPNFDITIGCT